MKKNSTTSNSSTSTADKAVIKKIQALLNVTTERGASEAEAASAANLAAKLLLKHGLSEAEVNQAAEGVEQEFVCEYEVTKAWHLGQYNWQVQIAHRIATNSLCHLLVSKSKGKQPSYFYFVGTPVDVQVAKLLFGWISVQCWEVAEATRKTVYKTRKAAGLDYHVGRGYFASLMLGVATRVVARLKEQYEADVQELGAESFVLEKYNAAEAAAAKFSDGKTVTADDLKINSEAYLAGLEAGDKVKLDHESSLEARIQEEAPKALEAPAAVEEEVVEEEELVEQQTGSTSGSYYERNKERILAARKAKRAAGK